MTAHRRNRYRHALGILTVLLLTACGGGGDGGGSGNPATPNTAPVANAGTAQAVGAGVLVTLNGTGSSDADGTIMAWSWTQTAGNPVALSNANTAQPSFMSPSQISGSTLSFSLIVTDNRGATSAAATVNITVGTNLPPTAHAVASQQIYGGNTVTLDAAQSTDTDGSIASYRWTQTAGPPVALSGSNAVQSTFVAPLGSTASSLTFSLVVTDNGGAASAAASVTVTVSPNLAPVAGAQALPVVATVGNHVTLSGTTSSDADGMITGYLWTQVGGPSVPVNNATSPQAFIVVSMATIASTLTFQLVVIDNRGVSSAPVTVAVAINPNTAPVANAGPPQTLNSGTSVILDGSASGDLEGGQLQYAWSQTAGPAVALNLAVPSRPNFVAPPVSVATTLTFRLLVTDNFGAVSAPSSVTITVNPAGTGMTTVSGLVRFARVPFRSSAPVGLDYAKPSMQPSRGVIVNAYSGTSGTSVLQLLGTGSTDANGAYSFTVPANMTMRIQVMARMLRDYTQPWPRWDFRIHDGGFDYNFMSSSFNSNAGTHHVDIPTGIAANGTASGTRASGPFAILDTIYTAYQAIVATGTAAEARNLELVIDWGSHRDGTYFTLDPATFRPLIKLQSDLTQNTDEFDQHVVAREFGRYLQYAYSRHDDLGGSHLPGDRLDMRASFSAGFATAFAAIALNDPVFRDSHVSGGSQTVSSFDVEVNPAGAAGCWCSMLSVASILWDLYDNNPDGSDSASLGLKPIWDELAGAMKVTQSLPTVFTFISALKAAQPAYVSSINSIVAAQNINSAGIDAYASNETNAPFPGMLPLMASIFLDGPPVMVRSIDDAGRHNKAGNHGFLRFTATTSTNVRLAVTTSNPNPDANPNFAVYHGSPDGISFGGGLWALGIDDTPQPEVRIFPVTAGRTYVVDIYDCANGCSNASGTPGDYTLTATLTTN